MLRIYNEHTKQKQPFEPLYPGEARIYSCGPTVYNYFHIGNARPFIVFDVLRRYLEHCGLKVTFVQNFTDIDDKMIRRAREENTTVRELGDKYIAEYWKDARALGIRPATHHPRATEHMDDIIRLIQTLIDKGHAYESDGDVYFSVQSFPQYGHMSGQDMEELSAGERVEVGESKRHPMDFALWKAEKPGEPSWDSPFGKGRPGWHIECSAMSMHYLGPTLDIHCGGQDLTFPHHENEVAQSEAATGEPFARYWMHNGFINVDSQKMSKSLGNFFTVRDILKEFEAEPVRLFMLSAHYRSPINFSREQIESAKSALERLYIARAHYAHIAQNGTDEGPMPQAFQAKLDSLCDCFYQEMDDDLNTAGAIGVLFDFVREANTHVGENRAAASAALEKLGCLADLLGILTKPLEEQIDPAVEQLVAQRQAARKAKNFAESDRLRDEICAMGYIVEDTPQGPKVRKA